MAVFATDDGQGNVRLYGATATDDGQGNVTLLVTEVEEGTVIAEDEVSLSLVDTSEYATKTELTQTADSITATVEEIEIGGRNLLRNTDTFSEWYINDRNRITVDDGVITWSAVSELAWNAIHGRDDGIAIDYSEVRGHTVTMSFEVRSDEYEALNADAKHGLLVTFALRTADSNARTRYGNLYLYDAVVSDEWGRIWVTVDVNDELFNVGTSEIAPDTDKFYVAIYNYSLQSVQVRRLKLEKGNKATDWTPASEDMATASSVKQTAEALTVEIGDAAKTATSFMSYDAADGLQIGNKTSGSWAGFRTQITSKAFNVLSAAGEVLASYGANLIELGKNSVNAIIKLCGGKGEISYNGDEDYFEIKGDNLRLNAASWASLYSYWTNGSNMASKTSVNVASDQVNIYSQDSSNLNDEVGTWRTTYVGVRPYDFHVLTDEIDLTSRYNLHLCAVSGDLYLRSDIGATTVYGDKVHISSNGNEAVWQTNENSELELANADGRSVLIPKTSSGNMGIGYDLYKDASGNLHLYGNTINMWSNTAGLIGRAYGENKVLWSGAFYMQGSHAIALSEAVSAQPHGIVLVWSWYANGAYENSNFEHFFIPKHHVAAHATCGVNCARIAYDSNMAKYVYIHDTKITGHDLNTEQNTTGGCTYNNRSFVLRYVIGV